MSDEQHEHSSYYARSGYTRHTENEKGELQFHDTNSSGQVARKPLSQKELTSLVERADSLNKESQNSFDRAKVTEYPSILEALHVKTIQLFSNARVFDTLLAYYTIKSKRTVVSLVIKFTSHTPFIKRVLREENTNCSNLPPGATSMFTKPAGFLQQQFDSDQGKETASESVTTSMQAGSTVTKKTATAVI